MARACSLSRDTVVSPVGLLAAGKTPCRFSPYR